MYCLHQNSDDFDNYKHFRNHMKTFHGKEIKFLRTDGGGKFNSNEFQNFLKQNGTTVERMMPYSSQENGSPERINQILMHYSNIPIHFWKQAIQHVAFIHNRPPSKSIHNNITPFDIWFRQKSDFSQIRIYECAGCIQPNS